MRTISITLAMICASALLAGQDHPDNRNPLLRQYRDGEALSYHMDGTNESWHYTIQADGVVKKAADGTFSEEYKWSNMRSNDQAVALTPASADYRQQLTLDPNHNPNMPNLSGVDPKLIGPITDFMTFYADLWLAVKTGQVTHAGDRFYFKYGAPSSWADGTYVQTGEDSIDFDMTLKAVNTADHSAVLLVRHVPPEKPQVHLRAEWMQAPVANTPNNWVQVRKSKEGKYLASVGKETFDVEIKVSLTDGKILSAKMDNPVQTIERECEDEALAKCGSPAPHLITRKIEISLVH